MDPSEPTATDAGRRRPPRAPSAYTRTKRRSGETLGGWLQRQEATERGSREPRTGWNSVNFVAGFIATGVQVLWFVFGTPLEKPVYLLAVGLGVLALVAFILWQKQMSPFWRVVLLMVAAAGLFLGPMLALGSPPPPAPPRPNPPGLGSGTNPGGS